MCGIAGIHRRTDRPLRRVGKLADELLLGIENRGRDSTGYLALHDDGTVQIDKEPVTARKFTRSRALFGEGVRTLLLHTRYATKGAVNRRNAHPVVSGPIAAVHNGTIYNDDHVFRVTGVERTAQVDSEAIPAVVRAVGWDQAADALATLMGGAATAIVDVTRPREVILARLRSYPLVMLVTDDLVVWASTEMAIRAAWRITYGTQPKGEWINVPEFTLIRVNGNLTTEAIEDLSPPKPKVQPRPWTRTVYGSGHTTTGSAPMSKRQRKRARRNGAVKAKQPRLPLVEPWMEDEVSAVMRWTGMSRADAEDEVFGVTLGHEDDPWESLDHLDPDGTDLCDAMVEDDDDFGAFLSL